MGEHCLTHYSFQKSFLLEGKVKLLKLMSEGFRFRKRRIGNVLYDHAAKQRQAGFLTA